MTNNNSNRIKKEKTNIETCEILNQTIENPYEVHPLSAVFFFSKEKKKL